MTQTTDARTRLRRLGQVDLGTWISVAEPDSPLWSIQKQIATALSKPNARVNVPSCVASGKALRNTEPVLTPKGWREIGSLAVGDDVYSVDGTVTQVVGVYPQGERQLYRVTLSDGSSVDADAEHLWTIKERRGAWHTVNTLRLATLAAMKQRGEVEFPTVEPVDIPAAPVPLDPYTVGLLLGDGGLTGTTPVFSTADPELLEAIPYETRHRSFYDYTVIGIFQEVRDLGMRGPGHLKRVPEVYLWNSPDVRLAVLQGLLDTDGGISGKGIEFSSTSEGLVEDVTFLARSLGAVVGAPRCRRTTYTYKGEKKTGRPSWRINITAPFDLFRLGRKVAQQREIQGRRKNTYNRGLRSVEPVGVDYATCIRVAHPSALFVTRDFIVTHNTFLAARLALAFYDAYQPGTPCDICKGPCGGAKVITTSSTEEHLKNNLWGEIRMAFPRIRDRWGFDGNLPPADTWINHSPNHFITGLVATKPEGFQGYHAAHILIIGDEATSVSDEVAMGIKGVLSTGDARLLLIYNPTDTTTYAAQQSRTSRTEVIRITAMDTPGFTGEAYPPGANLITHTFLEDLKDAGMGPGTYEWTTRVEAKFWDLTDDTLVAEKWYDEANGPHALLVPGERALGIDIAPYGSSESIIAARDGNTLFELRAFPAGRPDLFFQGPVTDAVRRIQPDLVIYDADGVGAGVVGEAEDLRRYMPDGGRVVGFRGAKKITPSHTNARAYWYWHLRRAFQTGEAAVTVSDPKAREQLTQIRYSISGGAIRVETKEEMKRRGFASPDRADGMMYAFAFSAPIASSMVRRPADDAAAQFGVRDRSDRAMWAKDLNRSPEPQVHPLLGCSDW